MTCSASNNLHAKARSCAFFVVNGFETYKIQATSNKKAPDRPNLDPHRRKTGNQCDTTPDSFSAFRVFAITK